MIVSALRSYIKEKKSVSMTQIILDLDSTSEQIEGPINILLEKNYIIKEQLQPGDTPKSKCKGCPMHCSQSIKDQCDPDSITVYSWNRY